MALFKDVVQAFVASKELDQASLSRLAFWVDELGEKEIAAIVDAVLRNDADAAAAACKRHVEQAERLAVQVLVEADDQANERRAS